MRLEHRNEGPGRIDLPKLGQPSFMNTAGTVQSTSPNSIRYSYTGREWDASLQLHHFRAKWMGPATGRFLVRDPHEYEGGFRLYGCSGFTEHKERHEDCGCDESEQNREPTIKAKLETSFGLA